MGGRVWTPKNNTQFVTVILLALCLAVSTATLIFGLLSWTRIRKWRQFHNYAFLQVIAASAMFITTYFCVRILYRNYHSSAAEILLEACFNVMLHWQLITTMVFYLEIFKVIALLIPPAYMYLFANLFAWLLPIVEVILDLRFQIIGVHFMEIIALLIAVVNTLLYTTVLYILIKTALTGAITGVEIFRHFLVSTFSFLTSVITLLVPLLTVLNRQGLSYFMLTEEDIVVTYVLNILAVQVFFLSIKNHRELWVEHRRGCNMFKDDVILLE